MIAFNGLINDNGLETEIRIFFDLDINEPYETDIYFDNKQITALIDNNSIIIGDVEYEYYVRVYQNETLIVGKEIDGIFHCMFPCFNNKKFFVVTDRQEV